MAEEATKYTEEASERTEEEIVGITFTSDDVELVVISTGCTTEKDFEIDVNKGFTGQPPYLLTVYRINPDNCRMIQHSVTLKFSRASLGLEDDFTLTVTNKFRNGPPAITGD